MAPLLHCAIHYSLCGIDTTRLCRNDFCCGVQFATCYFFCQSVITVAWFSVTLAFLFWGLILLTTPSTLTASVCSRCELLVFNVDSSVRHRKVNNTLVDRVDPLIHPPPASVNNTNCVSNDAPAPRKRHFKV